MFTVPVTAPDERRRRRAALALALTLNAAGLAALFAIPAAVAPPAAEAAPMTYVEVVSPPAPAHNGGGSRPAARRARPSSASAAVAPIVPAAPPAASPAVSPDASPALAPAALPSDLTLAVGVPGSGSGDAGAGDGSPGDGPPGDGATGTAGVGTIREVAWTQVRARRQVVPDYPAAALAAGLGEAVCTVRLAIDTQGRPTDAAVSGCPELLGEAARDAALRWRFAPLMEGRTPVPGRFSIRFRFRPDGG